MFRFWSNVLFKKAATEQNSMTTRIKHPKAKLCLTTQINVLVFNTHYIYEMHAFSVYKHQFK